MFANYAKWYTNIIGVFFLLILFSLVFDAWKFGFSLESVHKLFHILIGSIVVWQWNNQNFWRPFALYNGLFFLVVAAIGWLYPDLLSLDAFNRTDTILHTIVGASGVLTAIFSNQNL